MMRARDWVIVKRGSRLCPVRWKDVDGDDRVWLRDVPACRPHVFETRRQAEAAVAASK